MRVFKISIFILGFFIFILGIYLVFWSNKPYLLGCSDFFPTEKLSQWKDENELKIQQIQELGISIDYDTKTCVGKTGIILYYATGLQKHQLKAIIKNWTNIEAIPYKMVNI